ncbi:hypothetical protein GCM10025876_22570 [Demequina litorisediminis]|uniref:Uncharacterized protein n=1 Tax=Demequina litorisediminis TaxID=1849022 RepID=A0ABQ6IDV8_9MICO|nr:hypothetical protein GCM10025876_22570 [Demequina litorisediminis]
MRTEASSDVPTPTTAAEKSLAPSLLERAGVGGIGLHHGKALGDALHERGVALDGEHLDVHRVEGVGQRRPEPAKADDEHARCGGQVASQ